MSESARIADQLRRAHEGKAWHGPSLSELLSGVSAAQAIVRPKAGVHNIWELVAHIIAWERVGIRRLAGEAVHTIADEVDFPTIIQADSGRWQQTLDELASLNRELIDAILRLDDSQLAAHVPGQKVSVYGTLHGIIQHNLYHAGQIAILKKL
jgi:uncharacterized damage-inducible protein DinB